MRIGLIMGFICALIFAIACVIFWTTAAVLPRGYEGDFVLAGLICLLAAGGIAISVGIVSCDPKDAGVGVSVAATVILLLGSVILVTLSVQQQQPGRTGAYGLSGTLGGIAVLFFAIGTWAAIGQQKVLDAQVASITAQPKPVATTTPEPPRPAETPVPPAPPSPQPAEPKDEPSRAFRQRDERIRELVEASRSRDLPLDPMIVTSQLQDIEDDYRRQVAEETKS